ncbi:YrdB family protein [Streptomyces sp. NPDC048172]|uniref:YrdB family protein n=1 Tax=Streptomyces sp. NPDC048172 TaxID=3365505 RepID=UPI00371D2377
MIQLALANNPVLLGIRFLLELFALGCFALWGWRKTPGPWPARLLAAIALPVAVGWAWGSFAVSGDESRSGETDYETPGPLRLLLELAVLFGAVATLYHMQIRRVAKWSLIVMIAYQIAAYDRIAWLLSH